MLGALHHCGVTAEKRGGKGGRGSAGQYSRHCTKGGGGGGLTRDRNWRPGCEPGTRGVLPSLSFFFFRTDFGGCRAAAGNRRLDAPGQLKVRREKW